MNEKLYYPIKAFMYFYDNKEQYGVGTFDLNEIEQTKAVEYMTDILKAVEKYGEQVLNERGLMKYFGTDNSAVGQTIDKKVFSAFPSIEEIDGKLYGVTNLDIRESLAPAELSALKDYIALQMSDGYGALFEEREIKTHDGELCISFWSGDADYFIDTKQEFEQQLAMEAGQEFNNGSMQAPSM